MALRADDQNLQFSPLSETMSISVIIIRDFHSELALKADHWIRVVGVNRTIHGEQNLVHTFVHFQLHFGQKPTSTTVGKWGRKCGLK